MIWWYANVWECDTVKNHRTLKKTSRLTLENKSRKEEDELKIIADMQSYNQFPQERINHSLVTWLNGESWLHTHPMHPGPVYSALNLIVLCMGINGWIRQSLAQLVFGHTGRLAPKASGEIIHQLPTLVYFIYEQSCDFIEEYLCSPPVENGCT